MTPPLPETVDDLTAAWFADVLGREVTAAEVGPFSHATGIVSMRMVAGAHPDNISVAASATGTGQMAIGRMRRRLPV